MQTMWSRATQTRCRCTSCIHTATTIARRATTAASKRRVKAGDVFTACYSAMFATAAVVDAKMKSGRRKDWDRAIEEARGALEAVEGVNDAPASPRIHTTSTLRAVKPDVWTKLLNGKNHNDDSPVFGPKNNLYWTKNGVLTPPSGQESLLEERLQVIFRKVAYDSGSYTHTAEAKAVPKFIERNPKTDAQMGKLKQMISGMVFKLRNMELQSTHIPLAGSSSQPSTYTKHLQKMNKRISGLAGKDVSYPDYSMGLDPTKERLALNHAILTVLTDKETPIDLKVAKICFNLLISQAAPDITSFNLMILYFTHLEQHDLATVVADTLLYESRFWADETTVVALLEHYNASNNKAGFNMLVKRMRGVQGDMRLARRSLWHLRFPEVQRWALTNSTIHRNFHLHEKVFRSQAIFDSLIVAAYKFAGAKQALMYIRAAIREGFILRNWIFESLATACSVQNNIKLAEDLLRVMLSQWNSVTKRMPKFAYTTRQWLAKLVSLSCDTYGLTHDQLEQRFMGYERPLRFLLPQLQSSPVTDPLAYLLLERQLDQAADDTMKLKQEFTEIVSSGKLSSSVQIVQLPVQKGLAESAPSPSCALQEGLEPVIPSVLALQAPVQDTLTTSTKLSEEPQELVGAKKQSGKFFSGNSLQKVSATITGGIHRPGEKKSEPLDPAYV